ncbi:Alpha/Beta hydrolase protein [Syncephalis fuscata]|nr:Alpha/Beta hydrolase protein [Syncephalis fuscata]
MSSLQRKIFKAVNAIPENEEPEVSTQEDKEINNQLTGEQEQETSHKNHKNNTLVEWQTFFDNKRQIIANDGSIFCIYETHATNNIDNNSTTNPSPPPLFIFHHGAGQSALSFALTVKELKKRLNNQCSIVCYDCRGHGDTYTKNDTLLSLSQLTEDLALIVRNVHTNTKQSMVLIGHSMGGAVVADAVSRKLITNLTGVVVLDVVEGSAIESLAYMSAFIQSRPTIFDTLEDAIRWSIRSGGVRNIGSARISIPPLLCPSNNNDTQHPNNTTWQWRTDLTPTKPYWTEWFNGLSEKFLKCPTARLLVLAGADRLDNTLMIGQMQGKFQLLVFNQSGHHIQEDVPDRLAEALVEFQHRYQPLNMPIKRFPIPMPTTNKP